MLPPGCCSYMGEYCFCFSRLKLGNEISALACVLKGLGDERMSFGAVDGGFSTKVLLRALFAAAECSFADHFIPPNLPCKGLNDV